MATRGERWAFWLESELDRHGWQRADIPKRSRKKSNGRPIIDASRISEWLNNNESPRDPDILLELARIFGVATSVVLNAAGWLPDHELGGSAATTGETINDVAEAIKQDADLIEEARAHLLTQYELLRRLSPSPSVARGKKAARRAKTPSDTPLRAVARGGDPAHREEVSRMARRVREQQTNGEGTEDST